LLRIHAKVLPQALRRFAILVCLFFVASPMHDYFPIIARAVSRLESDTPKARDELFERVRKILIDQLRIRQPPPTDSDIRCERAALEEAIRRVEARIVTGRSRNGASLDASPVKRSCNTDRLRKTKHNTPSNGLGGEQGNKHHGKEPCLDPTKTTTCRDRPPAEARSVQRFDKLYQGMRAFLTDQRRQDTPSVLLTNASADAVQEKELDCRSLDSRDAATITASDRGTDATLAGNGSNSLAASPNSKDQVQCRASSRVNDLFSIHCLDELLRSGAAPLAPESLKRDSNAILQWLGANNAEALKPKHYEQFTQALRAYMMEWETSAGRPPTKTVQLPPSLNEDVRGIFSRMLEREQAAAVLGDALTWFGNVWIGLMLAVNLIATIILIAAAPNMTVGLGKLAATYSPFNFGCWVCQALAFAPAVIVIYMKRERLRDKDNAYERAEPAGTALRYRQMLRWRRDRVELRTFTVSQSLLDRWSPPLL
jgi:hypothetical protein